MDINYLNSNLRKQKEKYEQEIACLQKIHEEQIKKFCHELEKSSLLIYQYKLELDEMRLAFNLKNKNQQLSNQDLQTKNIELIEENLKLKKKLSKLIMKYRTLFKEMQDARQYVLKMIANLD